MYSTEQLKALLIPSLIQCHQLGSYTMDFITTLSMLLYVPYKLYYQYCDARGVNSRQAYSSLPMHIFVKCK